MWAGRIGAEIIRGEPGSDPASVAHRAVARAVEGGFDVCIVDTAGRLQTQANLMQELGKIRRVIAKQIADAPHETLLVIDATAGQNALSQAKGFKEAASCTGIVLAKLDGSARGGVIVPVTEQFDLPVKLVGLGEGADDMQPFDPPQFVSALLAGLFAEPGPALRPRQAAQLHIPLCGSWRLCGHAGRVAFFRQPTSIPESGRGVNSVPRIG